MLPDKGESELRKWALKRNGDPPSNEDIVSLVFAFADDFDSAYEETLLFFKESLDDRLDLRARVLCLEEWRQDSERTYQERVVGVFKKECEERYGRHMATCHSDESSFQQRFIWWWGSKIGYLIFSIIVMLVGYMLGKR